MRDETVSWVDIEQFLKDIHQRGNLFDDILGVVGAYSFNNKLLNDAVEFRGADRRLSRVDPCAVKDDYNYISHNAIW